MSSLAGRAAPARSWRNFVLQVGVRLCCRLGSGSPPHPPLRVPVLLASPKPWLWNCPLLVAFPPQAHPMTQHPIPQQWHLHPCGEKVLLGPWVLESGCPSTASAEVRRWQVPSGCPLEWPRPRFMPEWRGREQAVLGFGEGPWGWGVTPDAVSAPLLCFGCSVTPLTRGRHHRARVPWSR